MIPKWITSAISITTGTNILDKPGLETRLGCLDNWAAFFTLLVVIGVAGELVVHILSSRASSKLIALQNQEVAQANERTAQLERENLEIKQKMAWRSLSGNERKTFIASVRGAGRQVTIVELQDGEAWNYSEQIFSAFKEAGWAAGKNYRQLYDSGGVPRGVICRVSTTPDTTVQTVIRSLEQAGAKPNITQEAHLRPDFIEITVGLRPIE
jgi:hypothetical protein